jgi:asparagine synthase (glutamine-hydrolysing)
VSGFFAVVFAGDRGIDSGAAPADSRGAADDTALLDALAARIAPLGPHGGATMRLGPVGLGHTLLATHALALAGPFTRPDRAAGGDAATDCWLTGDVRLDARDDLRRAIEAAGVVVPADATDEALVLASWRAWGDDAASHLSGDFAFALWDPRRAELYCARDGLGVHPLFYAITPRGFVCSNTIGAVLAHPAVGRTLDEAAIVSFLQWGFNVNVTTTTFRDIQRLQAGHQFVVRVGRDDVTVSTPRRHWHFPEPSPLRYRREEEYVEQYRALLDLAVRERARPAGTALLLSGGLDSTSLAVTMRRIAPAMPITAFTSIITPLRPDDEAEYAASVAGPLGIRHIIDDTVPLSLAHLGDPAYRTFEPSDEPDAPGMRPWAAQIAAASPVLFIGEDGDALFLPPSILTMLKTWSAGDVLMRSVRYTLRHRHHPYLGLWLRRRLRLDPLPPGGAIPTWVRADLLARTGRQDDARLPPHPTRPETRSALNDSLWQNLHERSDSVHTHAAYEVRWPFLDERLLRFTLAIPPIPWCQRKELVRVAFRGELPEAVLRRPKTGLVGYSELQVNRWRRATGGAMPFPIIRAAQLIDTVGISDTLQRGSTAEVLAAWRALQLEDWLRGQ